MTQETYAVSSRKHPLSHIISYVTIHPVLANLLFCAVILVGLILSRQISVQSMPDFPWPVISVRLPWPGANAKEVHHNITLPLASELRSVSDLRRIESYSLQGDSYILMDFKTKADLSNAFDEVRNTIADIKLPKGADEPVISEETLHEPLLKLIIYGDQMNALRYWANQARQTLLSDYGMDRVKVIGLTNQQMNINVRAIDMHRLQLPITDLTNELIDATVQKPIGRFETDQTNMTVRAQKKPRRADKIDQSVLYLGNSAYQVNDIAKLDLDDNKRDPTIYYQNQPAVLLEIERSNQNGSNSLALVNKFYQWYESAQKTWPESIKARLFLKEYDLIKQRLQMLVENGLLGVLGIGLLLVVFIEKRLAFWIAMGIPTSILGATIIMYFSGITINFLSSFGFVMALGMIVDDTIVVAENAYTHFEEGSEPIEGVIKATDRMFTPVFAASLTTIAAFLPILLMQSRYAVFLQDIPKVMIAVIIASLVECFFILPNHLAVALTTIKNRQGSVKKVIQTQWQATLQRWQHHHLKKALQGIAKRAWVSLSLVVFSITLPIVLLLTGHIPQNFVPYIARDYIALDVEFYPGTARTAMQEYMSRAQKALRQAEQKLTQNQENIVQTSIIKYQLPAITSETPLVYEENRSDHASIVAELSSPSQRQVTNHTMKKQWTASLPASTIVKKATVVEPQSETTWQDINLIIQGSDWNTLTQAALFAKQRLQNYDSVSNITNNSPWGNDEYEVITKKTAHMLGMTKGEISKQLRQSLRGGEVIVHHLSGNEKLTIQVKLSQQEVSSPAALESLPITIDGKQLTLGDIADLKIQKRPLVYYLHNGQLAIRVGANIDTSRVSAAEVRKAFIKNDIPAITQQYNVNITEDLQSPDEKDALHEMRYGVVIGGVCIYFILAWVSRSYWWPLAMMLIIPLGFSGALLGHYVTQTNFSILSIIAIFGLSGIVVNTSIILFDQYQRLASQYPKQTVSQLIIKAICCRARAMMLTTVTTATGLLPILLEQSQQAKWVHPFAVSIIFGLLFSVIMMCSALPAVSALLESRRLSHIK